MVISGHISKEYKNEVKLIHSLTKISKNLIIKCVESFKNKTALCEDTILETYNYVLAEKIKLSSSDSFVHVLLHNKLQLYQYNKSLKELGINQLETKWISGYFYYLQKSLKVLKAYKFLDDINLYSKKIVSYLNISKFKQQEILKQVENKEDIFPLSVLQKLIIFQYLSLKFNLNNSISFTQFNRNLCWPVSFEWLDTNINILVKDFGFCYEIIMNNLRLLSTVPDNLIQILNADNIQEELKHAALIHPDILLVPYEKIISVTKIARKYNFPLLPLFCNSSFFNISIKDIEKLFQSVEKISFMKTLDCSSERYLKAIKFLYLVSNRTEYLNNIKVSLSNQAELCLPVGQFENLMTGNIKIPLNVINLLCNLSNLSSRKLSKQLIGIPKFHNVTLKMITENFEYFKSLGFTRNQIINSIAVLIYPPQFIKNTCSKIQENPKLKLFGSNWICHPQALQFLMYVMDKKYNF